MRFYLSRRGVRGVSFRLGRALSFYAPLSLPRRKTVLPPRVVYVKQEPESPGMGLRWMLIAIILILLAMYLSNAAQAAWLRDHPHASSTAVYHE